MSWGAMVFGVPAWRAMWTVRATSSTITAALTAACASLPIVNGPWLRQGGPCRGVRRVCVDDTADVGHMPIDVGVGGSVRRRCMVALDQCAEEVGDDHVRCRQLVVGDSRGFDDHEVVPGHAGRHVAGGPDDQSVSRELAMQVGDSLTQRVDGVAGARGHVGLGWYGVRRCRRHVSSLLRQGFWMAL